MKLVIPGNVEAGPHNYRIIFDDKSLRVADVRGQVNHTEQIIRLSKWGTYESGVGLRRKPPALLESLLHELLHIHNNLWCGNDLTEQQIEALAAGLAQSLLSLGIELNFNQVPGE